MRNDIRIVLFAAFAGCCAAQANVLFVDQGNCPGPGNGSEGDPFCSIQSAIVAAAGGDEILVAPGVYAETVNFLSKAIRLRSTGGPEVTVIDAQRGGPVVTMEEIISTPAGHGLEGFTLTGGSAPYGGGVYNFVSSPTIRNCVLTENSADFLGGGLFHDQGTARVIDCTFLANTAVEGGGATCNSTSITVIGCTFSANTTAIYGGAMIVGTLYPHLKTTIANCTFIDNYAGIGGGAMFNETSGPAVTGCAFIGNTTGGDGGAIYNEFSHLALRNCTFTGNTAESAGGAVWSGQGTASPFLGNCILWGDSPDEIVDEGVTATTVVYSDVQGGWAGTGYGNIDADPAFVDPALDDVRLLPGSPCVDAGHNWVVPQDSLDLDADGDAIELTPIDLEGNPRFVHALAPHPGCGVPAVVDMGAYELPGGTPAAIRLGDLDGDGTVETVDLLILLDGWGACTEACCLADLSLDGSVGIADFLLLLQYWG